MKLKVCWQRASSEITDIPQRIVSWNGVEDFSDSLERWRLNAYRCLEDAQDHAFHYWYVSGTVAEVVLLKEGDGDRSGNVYKVVIGLVEDRVFCHVPILHRDDALDKICVGEESSFVGVLHRIERGRSRKDVPILDLHFQHARGAFSLEVETFESDKINLNRHE